MAGWAKKLADSDAAKVAAFAGDVAGVASLGFTIYEFFSEDAVAQRLAALEQLIRDSVAAIERLITEQTGVILQELQEDTNKEALAKASAGRSELLRYRNSLQAGAPSPVALAQASALSSEAFTRLVLDARGEDADPGILPYLIDVGLIRMAVLSAFNFADKEALWSDIKDLYEALENLITRFVRVRVAPNHRVVHRETRVTESIEWCEWVHFSQGQRMSPPGEHEFICGGANWSKVQYEQAKRERDSGVRAEAEWLGIEEWETAASEWRSLYESGPTVFVEGDWVVERVGRTIERRRRFVG